MYKIADAHSDFLSYNTLKLDDSRLFDHADAARMRIGGIALQTLAVWVPSEYPDNAGAGLAQIRYLNKFIADNPGFHLCTTAKHLTLDEGIGVILAIESGESIGCRSENISKVYDLGARMVSLTWNDENAFASGCMDKGGIKPEGLSAIAEMNRLRIALDVSHINERGFWEAIEQYAYTPCASHSCVYDLCPVPRNLTRDQIVHLISQGGFIGVNFYTEFLRGRYARIDDILDHVEYILDCGGENSVGFGSDFCGIQYTPEGLSSVADFQKLPDAMKRRGYPEDLIKKICYGNFARYVLEFLQ